MHTADIPEVEEGSIIPSSTVHDVNVLYSEHSQALWQYIDIVTSK
jgi:hypothetical protein